MFRSRKSATDRRSDICSDGVGSNKEQLRQALDWLLECGSLKDLALHGNTSWQPKELVVLAILWVWSPAKRVGDAFEEACQQSRMLIGDVALRSYQGLAGALETWTPTLIPLLQLQLQRLMEQIGGRHFRIHGFLPIAVDGSACSAPRTQSNEEAFCAKNFGHGKNAKFRDRKNKRRRRRSQPKRQPHAPRVWITLLWHMRLRLPWCWQLGPSNSSEREHLLEMIAKVEFPPGTLFVGDAGFVGFQFWRTITQAGHDFLVRVGGNIHLLRDSNCDIQVRKDLVFCWPKFAIRKNLPPLQLRMIRVKIGRKKMTLLTSVLNEKKLNPKLADKLYQQRWGVEVEFRGLKQTFERGTLRSHKSERVLAELNWSIFGMAVVELFALKRQSERKDVDPAQRSLVAALRAIRKATRQIQHQGVSDESLSEELAAAIIDNYQRNGPKAARYQPKRSKPRSTGHPKIDRITKQHRMKIAQLQQQTAA